MRFRGFARACLRSSAGMPIAVVAVTLMLVLPLRLDRSARFGLHPPGTPDFRSVLPIDGLSGDLQIATEIPEYVQAGNDGVLSRDVDHPGL